MHNAYSAMGDSVFASGGILAYLWKNLFPGPEDNTPRQPRHWPDHFESIRAQNQAQNQPQNDQNNGVVNIWENPNSDKDKHTK